MNCFMQEQWSIFEDTHGMRTQLMVALSDADLAFSPGGQNMTLGALCREIGEIEHSYIESIKTLKQDWSYRNTDHQRSALQVAKVVERLIPQGEVLIVPVDVVLDEKNTVQPDVLWAAEGSQCQAVEGKYLLGATDLVMEVLSPGPTLRDRRDKFRL